MSKKVRVDSFKISEDIEITREGCKYKPLDEAHRKLISDEISFLKEPSVINKKSFVVGILEDFENLKLKKDMEQKELTISQKFELMQSVLVALVDENHHGLYIEDDRLKTFYTNCVNLIQQSYSLPAGKASE